MAEGMFNKKPGEAQDLTMKSDRGVLKVTVRKGRGVQLPSKGDRVRIHYTGRLEDGTIFVTTTNTARKPLEFELGADTVIKALDLAAGSMKQGEVSYFECKPKYAYGKRGKAELGIPPYAMVIFQIEMMGWVTDITEKKDGGILKEVIRIGQGVRDTEPREGDALDIQITGEYDGNVFEERDLTFPLGEGCEYGICEGVEFALSKFRMNEKSRLELEPNYAFGASGKPEFNIPPNAKVEYTVWLRNIKRMKNIFTLTFAELDEQCNFVKEKATKYFKEGKYALAARIYNRLQIYAVGVTVGYTEEMEEKLEYSESEIELLKTMHLNIALCFLKMDMNLEARGECEEVLKLDPNNEKALYRRGQTYMNRAEAEEAIQDFEKVLEINPKNGAAIKNLRKCRELKKRQHKQQLRDFNHLFDKMARLPDIDVPKESADDEEVDEVNRTYPLRNGPWNDVKPKKKKNESLKITELDDDGNPKKN